MVVTVDTAPGSRTWTSEQQLAIERRDGSLLLAAGAGSGKTSVLVERFVSCVVRDGIGVGEILTITFTEKAAAEMRDRIRTRLRELGEDAAAAATEGAYIATIHGFCARVLRAQALSAGLDPGFQVLDEHDARRLAAAAFEDALEALAARGPAAIDFIAGYGADGLYSAIRSVYAELRSRGQLRPALPALAPAAELAPALAGLRAAGGDAATELRGVANPGVRVTQALERLARCAELTDAEPRPGTLDELALPRGNGAALSTPVCTAYTEALDHARAICAHRRALGAHRLLDELLSSYGENYTALKRARSGLDFEDLELLTAELLSTDAGLRERYRERFARIMVDELQDTNTVQLALIGSLARDNLFTVGDAQQAIYGFRHADVELFEELARRRRRTGAFASLQVNFRSRPEILEVLNATFEQALGERFSPLHPGRDRAPGDEPVVELLLADKGADWESDGLASPWRQAEARILAGRVAQLVAGGTSAREIVVLTRATSDLRTYERALEQRGVPTYVIGGRGYWGHPQVLDLVAYLQALANPREEEALYTVLASPLVGVSFDALVVLGAAAKARRQDPFTVLRAGAQELDGLGPADQELLAGFVAWFEAERAQLARLGLEQVIDRVLVRTGYDLWVLARADGRRRMANVRKLMRLAREHEAEHGPELRAFVRLIGERAGGADARESEAPVEGEALDAVRLMTIHRSKGLEFDTVCVADLGRAPWSFPELMRVGADGRFGLRLAEPGTGRREEALDYRALGEARKAREEDEERRLFYVAMTRARERLVLSGAARLHNWPEGNTGAPIGWIAPALIPDFGERIDDGTGVTERGVAYTVVRDAEAEAAARSPAVDDAAADDAAAAHAGATQASLPARPPAAGAELQPAPSPTGAPLTLSYSALADYHRCGYRFYAERVLGLPPLPVVGAPPAVPDVDRPGPRRPAAERGVLAHAVLEALDFRRPIVPSAAALARISAGRGLRAPDAAEAEELEQLVRAFAATELRARLAQATQVRREQRFSFALGSELLIGGALDVIARERGGMLVIDYKTDRVGEQSPAELVARHYATQQLVYALAALLGGASVVEVAHVFLARPDEPVLARFQAVDRARLTGELEGLAAGVAARRFEVAAEPVRAICDGCPAQGGLCSWPLAMTRRERADQLF